MGLESSTFISGLTASWPLAGDPKSQGDDHIRLVKAALQSTFPNASKAFRFPEYQSYGANRTMLAADQNAIVGGNSASGNLVFTLPTLGSGDGGWFVDVIKITTDYFGISVVPASGNILTRAGSVSSVYIVSPFEPVRFLWTGSGWTAMRTGALIGTVVEFDGVTLPPGWLYSNGSTFNGTLFTELNAVLGTTTLRDRSGRMTIGREGMGGSGVPLRVTAAESGIDATVAGAVGGDQRLATHSHANSFNFDAIAAHSHGLSAISKALFLLSPGGSGVTLYGASLPGGGAGINTDTGGAHTPSGTLTNANTGSGGSANIPPAIVADKIIKAA